MTKLTQLQKEASESTTFRGHRLGEWKNSKSGAASVNRCLDCGFHVDVCTMPLPNEIEIGGEAVALTCTVDKGVYIFIETMVAHPEIMPIYQIGEPVASGTNEAEALDNLVAAINEGEIDVENEYLTVYRKDPPAPKIPTNKLDLLILGTPSGEFRNKLTVINLILTAINEDEPEIEKIIDSVIK